MTTPKPPFDMRCEGHAYAHFSGPRDPESIASIIEYLRREKWRGQLNINLSGNGGITDIIFHEIKRATIDKSSP